MSFIRNTKLCSVNVMLTVLFWILSLKAVEVLSLSRGHVHYLGGPRSLARSDGQMGCPVHSVI